MCSLTKMFWKCLLQMFLPVTAANSSIEDAAGNILIDLSHIVTFKHIPHISREKNIDGPKKVKHCSIMKVWKSFLNRLFETKF